MVAASVVIPAYNHARFVGAAVASVLDCRGVPLELIVVDDGSSDGTAEVVTAIADPRLRLERQENRGAHAAFNRGLELARGEVVFFLNSDDLFRPGHIERALEVLRRDPGVALVGSWLELIDEHGTKLGEKHGWRDLPPWPPPTGGATLSQLGDPSLALLETNFLATTSTVACRRELFARHGLRFLPLRYAHDWELFLAALAHGRLHLIEEPLVGYRVHGANTIREGQQGREGAMRFEILWLLARHARRVLARRGADRSLAPAAELERRCWHGLPRFGAEGLLLQLLQFRGSADEVPPAYDRLLDPAHPWRQLAERDLGA